MTAEKSGRGRKTERVDSGIFFLKQGRQVRNNGKRGAKIFEG